LDQPFFHKPNNSYMLPVMVKIAYFLSCEVKSYRIKPSFTEILIISVESIFKREREFHIKYFNKFPLIEVKGKYFKCWQVV